MLRFWGSTHSKNKYLLAGRSFFQNLGSQGPGRVSPGGSSRAAPSTFFAACSEASGGFNCASKVLLNPSFGARSAPNILSSVTFGIEPVTPPVCDSEVVLQIYYVKTMYFRCEKYQVLQIYHVKTIYLRPAK